MPRDISNSTVTWIWKSPDRRSSVQSLSLNSGDCIKQAAFSGHLNTSPSIVAAARRATEMSLALQHAGTRYQSLVLSRCFHAQSCNYSSEGSVNNLHICSRSFIRSLPRMTFADTMAARTQASISGCLDQVKHIAQLKVLLSMQCPCMLNKAFWDVKYSHLELQL